MDKTTLKTMLSAPTLGLEYRDGVFHASEETPLTLVLTTGSDLLRVTKVIAVELEGDLGEASLIGLVREEAYAVAAVSSVFSVERDRVNEQREKRRTGFV